MGSVGGALGETVEGAMVTFPVPEMETFCAPDTVMFAGPAREIGDPVAFVGDVAGVIAGVVTLAGVVVGAAVAFEGVIAGVVAGVVTLAGMVVATTLFRVNVTVSVVVAVGDISTAVRVCCPMVRLLGKGTGPDRVVLLAVSMEVMLAKGAPVRLTLSM